MALFQWLKDTYAGNQRPAVYTPDDSQTMPVRRRYRFSGVVQCVGFRYEAKMLAGQLGLAGWAQNKSDGTVVVEVEGSAGRIDEFVRAIQAVPRFDISDIQEEELPSSGSPAVFKILY